MIITVRSHWLLRLTGHFPVSATAQAIVAQDLRGWMRSAWWRLRHPLRWR